MILNSYSFSKWPVTGGLFNRETSSCVTSDGFLPSFHCGTKFPFIPICFGCFSWLSLGGSDVFQHCSAFIFYKALDVNKTDK